MSTLRSDVAFIAASGLRDSGESFRGASVWRQKLKRWYAVTSTAATGAASYSQMYQVRPLLLVWGWHDDDFA